MADFIVDSTKFYASGDGLSMGKAKKRISAARGLLSDPITDAAGTLPYPGGGSSCYSHDDSRIALSASGRGSKFTIAHETGHFMHWHLNDYYSDDNNGEYILTGCNEYSCPDPDCSDGGDSHRWRSQENQGCAAKEGHADYYAAAVYNDWNETDCNYRENNCGANQTWMELNCPLYAYKRGVESDWAQFYWELTSVCGWGVRLVTQLFVEPDNYWDHAEVWETLRDSVLALHPTLYLPFVLSGDNTGINH